MLYINWHMAALKAAGQCSDRTENKLPTDEPIRIIVMYDVPMLSAALKFD
jgi:hypothetical protein